ncbi:MAG: LysO family transporter [Peptoclostridium sp.]|uniref:lysine exporter LysO family protein n=1 Tax=Peptoclostridium sp. TaxID=1904860 RepID=UPI00139D5E1B|nr:lysine exporter LysO family protein [Peptoclostridium sp.]MZQ75954.1 LysO family transporter [Peptoclostridium sp.]
MPFVIITAIITGIVSGIFIMPESFLQNTDLLATVALNALLLLIGIEVGSNKNVLRDIKNSGLASIAVPASIIAGSLIGGLVTGIIFGIPHNISLSIASGFGWYSLSGIMLTKLANAQIGTIAFMTNVLREIIAVISIPYIAKYLNHYSAIAPAGATSMDTTLPLISKATSPSVVVVSFINGVLLSSLVPFFVTFFFSI